MGETIYNLAFDFGASSGRMILSKYAFTNSLLLYP